MNGGTYGGDFSLKWGLDVKDEMPLLVKKVISEEYENQVNKGGFNSLKYRKEVDPNSLEFPEDFNLIRSEINVVDTEKYPDQSLFLDLGFSVEDGDGATYRWSGYVTPENEVYPHYYTKLKVD